MKNIEASMTDMGSKEVMQDRFKRWNNNKPLFPKRKKEVDVVEIDSKKREVLPPISLEKNKLEALIRA